MIMTFDLDAYFKEKKQLVDDAIQTRWLSPHLIEVKEVYDSMAYSFLAGGKRIRPILAFASAEALGVPVRDVIPIAAALEMIHVFSLIHDDLPAMDDDNFRRGQPTNHKVFGEAMAILAADGFHALAFSVLCEIDPKKYHPVHIIKMIQCLAEATGVRGMIGGQVLDINAEGKKIPFEHLKTLHALKTGALIKASVLLPAILCGLQHEKFQALAAYGDAIGLAFQIADDILDVEGGEEIGKDIGSDAEKQKSTYVTLLGLAEAKRYAQESLEQAKKALTVFDTRADVLRSIAAFVVNRKS